MRDANGEPTGELKEAAQSLIRGYIPRETPDEIYRSFVKHMDEAAADGLTAAQNASWSPEHQPVFERALAANAFKLRIRFAPLMLPNEGGAPKEHILKEPLTAADLAEYRRLRDEFKGPVMEFGAIKGFLDGTVDARTAAMFEPYVGGGTGIPFWEQDDLNKTVALYDKEGFQVLLHAIGDKAINMALNAFEYAAKTNGTHGRRHRVEHGEVPRLSDLPRFKQLGVIASTQALFAMPDATVLSNYAVLLGPERASHANAFKLYDDAGAVQAFGSDWGVFDFAPLRGIHVAVTRLTPEGSPKGGWYPQNRISVEAALRHYTRDGAYANFDEQKRGTLTPGKLADLVVLSRDILTIPPTDILKTRVLLTVMGGHDTYRAPEFR
jgi:predicted amidohydrolase YtcJ